MNLRVVPYLDGETSKQAARRLTDAGRILGNTYDLAGFLHNHPKEVKKWLYVLAISKDSRVANPEGHGPIFVPFASVNGPYYRNLSYNSFCAQLNSHYGVLIIDE